MTALGKRVEWKSAGSHSVKMGHLENWKAFSKLISQNDKNSKSQEKRLKTLFPQVWEFAGLETRSDEEGIEMKHRNKLQTLNCCRYLGLGIWKHPSLFNMNLWIGSFGEPVLNFFSQNLIHCRVFPFPCRRLMSSEIHFARSICHRRPPSPGFSYLSNALASLALILVKYLYYFK